MQSRTDIFSRIPEKIAFLAEMPDYDPAIFFNKKQKSDESVAKEVLPLLLPVLEEISDWTEQNIHDVVMEKIQQWERKTGSVLWPMRISISGQESTPGGAFEIAYLLGKSETLKRMHCRTLAFPSMLEKLRLTPWVEGARRVRNTLA